MPPVDCGEIDRVLLPAPSNAADRLGGECGMSESWSAYFSAGVVGVWDGWGSGSGEESISIESSAPASNAGGEDAVAAVSLCQRACGDACGEIFAERRSVGGVGIKPCCVGLERIRRQLVSYLLFQIP